MTIAQKPEGMDEEVFMKILLACCGHNDDVERTLRFFDDTASLTMDDVAQIPPFLWGALLEDDFPTTVMTALWQEFRLQPPTSNQSPGFWDVPLTHQQRDALAAALLRAFPSFEALSLLVRRALGKKLDEWTIVDEGATPSQIVQKLLHSVEARHFTRYVVIGALRLKPQDGDILYLAQCFGMVPLSYKPPNT